MNKADIQNKISQIAKNMVPGFSSEESLLDQFDSLQIIELVSQVEQAFAVQIPAIELSRDNLKSVDSLATLISRYQIEK